MDEIKAAGAVHRGSSEVITPKTETPPSGTQRATRRGKKTTGQIHKVEYTVTLPDGTRGKVTQFLSQAALSRLLLEEGVVLLNVNKPDPVYFPRKKKK